METTVKSLFDICALKTVGSKLVDVIEHYASSGMLPAGVYRKIYNIVSRELEIPCSICTDEDGHGPLYCERNGEIISITCLNCIRLLNK